MNQSFLRKLYLVEVAADQARLGPKLPCPCLYWVYLTPFLSSLPHNLSLSLTTKSFILIRDECSVFWQWGMTTEKS